MKPRTLFIVMTVVLLAWPARLVGGLPSVQGQEAAAPVESGVYTEDFTAYTAKDYTDQTVWDIWARSLRLARLDATDQYDPAIARDGNGNLFVVWQDGRAGNRNIYAQKLDANGNPLWAADVRVNSDGGTAEKYPAVAVDGGGNAIVVWASGGIEYGDIYAQRLDAGGSRLWAQDLRVNSDGGTAYQLPPTVAVDGGGNAVVVWVGYRNYNYDIYAQRVDAGGNRLWAQDVRVSADGETAGRYYSPAVAVDGDGRAFVVWDDERNGNWDIYAQRLDAGGNRLWAQDLRVNTDAETANQYRPAVAVDGSGHAFVVWRDERNGNPDIYAQRLDAGGNRLLTADVRVNMDGGTAYQSSPAMAVDGGGNAVVVWQDNRNGNYDIYAQRLDAGGNPLWAADVLVNSDGGTAKQEYPAVAVDGGGQAVVVWEDYRNGDYYRDIYVQRVDVGGNPLWAQDARVNSDGGTADQGSPAVAVDGGGNAVVVWQDNRNGNYDIYAQRLDAGGNRLWAQDLRVESDGGTVPQRYPAVAVDGGGQAVVVWADWRNGVRGIYAQRLNAQGNRLWAQDLRVNAEGGMTLPTRDDPPVVALDRSGNAVVVWADVRNGNTDIYAQRVDAGGNRLWAQDVRVNSDGGTAEQWFPAVAVDGGGNAFVVWTDERNGNRDIYAQRLDAGGNRRWVADVQVSADGGTADQKFPAVAVDGGGHAVVVWWGDNWDLYAQRLDAVGSRLWAQDLRVNSDEGKAYQRTPAVAVDWGGNIIVVWQDYRNGNQDIYAQRLDAGGSRLWAQDARVNSDGGTAGQYDPAVAVEGGGNAFVVWYDERNGNEDIYAQKVNSVGGKAWLADLQVVYPELFYLPTGTAQSRTVDTITGNITQATLTADVTPNGGSVQFYLTNDGGAHWAAVTPGVAHVFTATGSDLRWRAVLTGDPVWRSRTPLVNSLRIEYSTQVPYADDYEPDDTCAQARPIGVNGAAQAHTFHQQADADWVWFDVISGTTYIVQTANTQANADTTLELYRDCPKPPLAGDDNAFGREARITWRAAFSGPVRVRVANHNPAVYGADTGYDLSVRTFTQPPVAVIVAGHDNRYSLQSNIDTMADMAYRTLLNSGVPKANIRYFGPNPARDVDGNGLNDDIFATVTIAGVRDAVQDWARERGVRLGVPFYLYLVDHGHYDQFLAAGTANRLWAADLNLWLSNLEATSGADNINVIIEACKSGSFIDITTFGPAAISGRNRVVIASTSSMLNAYPSAQGGYFSDVFWTAVGQNQDLKTAFEWARQAVEATGLSQVPWLDDNGDAVADGRDGTLARGRGLGGAFAGSPPVIDWVQVGQITGGQAAIQAQVRDDFGVSSVRVVIYPPGFVEPPPAQDGTTPVLNVPTKTLGLVSANLFGVTYTGFTQTGQYRLVVYAQDMDGNQALPVSVFANVGGSCSVYLPLVIK